MNEEFEFQIKMKSFLLLLVQFPISKFIREILSENELDFLIGVSYHNWIFPFFPLNDNLASVN